MSRLVTESSNLTLATPQRDWSWIAITLGLLFLLGCTFFEGLSGTAAIDATPYMRGQDALYAAPGARVSLLAYGQADPSPQLQHQPWDRMILQAYREGRWPLWQPHNGFGAPLLGNGQSGVFNPLKLLAWGGPTSQVLAWFLVLRLAIGGVGTLLLGRRLGLSAWAAGLAAGSFALSGHFAYHFHNNLTHTMVLLPWLLLATWRLLERPTLGSASLLGLTIGVLGVVGHPEAAIFAAMGACAVYGIEVLVRPHQARGLALLGLAFGLGAALAAVLVLPLLELAAQSRSYLMDKSSAPQTEWIPKTTLIAFGRHLLSSQALPNPYYFNAFIGAVALVLTPFGLARAGVRRTALALLATAMAIFALCEPSAPVHWLPVSPKSHYAVPLAILGLALLAGSGLDGLLAARRRLPTLVVMGLSGAGLALAYLIQTRVDAFYRETGYPHWTGEYWLALWAFTAILAVMLLHLVRPMARPVLAGSLMLVAAVHLAASMRVAVPPRVPLGYPVTPAVAFLMAQPAGFRLAGGQSALLPNANAVHGLDSIELEDPFPSRRYVAFHQLLNDLPAPAIDTDYALRPGFNPAMLDLASVRYLLVAQSANGEHMRRVLAARPTRYPIVARQPGVAVHENLTALPRARVVYQAEFAHQDGPTVAARLKAGGDRWRDTVLVETPDGLPPPTWQNQPSTPTKATYERLSPETVRIEARLSLPGWLVVGDAPYPGWRAYVDGRSTPILPANLAMQTIALPPGEHEVILRYEPGTVRRGAMVSLVALALAFLGLAFAHARRWWKQASPRSPA